MVTLSPVVVWMKIRLIVTLAIIHKWETRQIDFELAYPQAEVKEMYMRLPKGFKLGHSGIQDTHVLKLLKNIYGLKQAGRVWNSHFTRGLMIWNTNNPRWIYPCTTGDEVYWQFI